MHAMAGAPVGALWLPCRDDDRAGGGRPRDARGARDRAHRRRRRHRQRVAALRRAGGGVRSFGRRSARRHERDRARARRCPRPGAAVARRRASTRPSTRASAPAPSPGSTCKACGTACACTPPCAARPSTSPAPTTAGLEPGRRVELTLRADPAGWFDGVDLASTSSDEDDDGIVITDEDNAPLARGAARQRDRVVHARLRRRLTAVARSVRPCTILAQPVGGAPAHGKSHPRARAPRSSTECNPRLAATGIESPGRLAAAAPLDPGLLVDGGRRIHAPHFVRRPRAPRLRLRRRRARRGQGRSAGRSTSTPPRWPARRSSCRRCAARWCCVDFWASWCEPCKKELPLLDKLAPRLHARGIEIVAVNIDDDTSKAADFLRSHGLHLTVVSDTSKKIVGAWEPPKMPSSFVVDKAGVVRAVHGGFEPGDEAKLEARADVAGGEVNGGALRARLAVGLRQRLRRRLSHQPDARASIRSSRSRCRCSARAATTCRAAAPWRWPRSTWPASASCTRRSASARRSPGAPSAPSWPTRG